MKVRGISGLLLVLGCLATAHAGPYHDGEREYAAGHFEAARSLFEAALAQPKTLPVAAAFVEARLGLALRKLGQLIEAEKWLDAAITDATADDDLQTAAVARRYLGRVKRLSGDFPAALALGEAARDYHAVHGPPRDLLAANLELAAYRYTLGELQAAYDLYTDALQSAVDIPDPAREAVALIGLGLVLNRFGDSETAEELIANAEATYERLGQPAGVTRARGYRATILVNAGKWNRARKLAEAVLKSASDQVFLDRQAYFVLAQAWLRSGEPKRAAAVLKVAFSRTGNQETRVVLAPLYLLLAETRLELGDLDGAEAAVKNSARGLDRSVNRAWAATVRGRIMRAHGDLKGAVQAYETSVELDEGARERIDSENLPLFYGHERVKVYLELLDLYVATGRLDDALRLGSMLKARTLVDQLKTVRSKRSPDRPREERLRLDAARYGAASRVPFPAWPGLDALRSRLPDDLAVVDYYVLPDRLLLFWVTGKEIAVESVRVKPDDLRRHVAALSRAMSGGQTDYAGPARWLAQRLIEPIAARLESSGVRELCIIPHGPLHAVPFVALPFRGQPAVMRWAIFAAPSVAGLGVILERETGVLQRPWLAVGDVRGELPGARENAERLGGSAALIGEAATEAAVRAELPSASAVHLAVHGYRGGDGESSYLDLRAGDQQDGRLHAFEIASMKLHADLVSLPACDTAAGTPNPGDEIPDVMDRAFLAAGARSVIATRWAANDRSAARFMRRFYQELKTHGRVEALARVQREFIRSAQASPRVAMLTRKQPGANVVRGLHELDGGHQPAELSHPYHWAVFRMTGDYR